MVSRRTRFRAPFSGPTVNMAVRKSRAGSPDYFLLVVFSLLVVGGLVMLSSASSDVAKVRFGDSLYFLKHQIEFGLGLGVVGFLVGLFMSLRNWEKIAVPVFVISLVLLLLVVFTSLGFGAKGSERWLRLGPITFQPAELVKLTLFLFLASWFSRRSARAKEFVGGFLPFMVILSITIALIVIQPATTIAFTMLIAALIVHMLAGGRLWHTILAILIYAALFAGLVLSTPYRAERILTYLNPERDNRGASYQIQQTLLAVGSGGVTGVGFGKSTTKIKSLPEPIGDSIFAVIGEELGFIGAGITILLFGALVFRCFYLARAISDLFSRLFVVGFISLLGIQAFVHIGSVIGIIPFTGVPLPFVSYGGTSLAVFLTMSGIVVNISRHTRR